MTSSSGGAPSPDHQNHQERESTLYTHRNIPAEMLDPAFAAVNIIMATKESSPLLIPPHLPESRAIATLRNASGPTMEDFRHFQSYQTPLFADYLCDEERVGQRGNSSNSSEGEACGRLPLHGRSIPHAVAAPRDATRSDRRRPHDLDFAHIYGFSDPLVPAPGTFSGLWQGSYMVRSLTALACPRR